MTATPTSTQSTSPHGETDDSDASAALNALFDHAASQLDAGAFDQSALVALRQASLAAVGRPMRQRLLYLHATEPIIGAGLIASTIHEPRPGGCGQLDPEAPDLPYQCVHDAVADGWQVIQFPLQQLMDQRPGAGRVTALGYEFILQKMEPVCDD